MPTDEKTVVSLPPLKALATVLLVDDEPTLLSLTKSILRHQGFEVLTSLTAEGALEVAASYKGIIDFLVCDLNLPGKSGIYLANELRVSRELKVVIVSGDIEIETIVKQLNFPLLGYFEKPFSIRDLAQMLEDSLITA